MKKTLFAMLALALCGTAFGEAEFKVHEYDTELDSMSAASQPITVIVDDSKTLTMVDLEWDHSFLTLSFVGENTLNTEKLYTRGAGGYAVVGDSVAMTSWGEKLTSSTDITTIALANNATNHIYIPAAGTSFTFAGTEANQSITLGDTEMKYLGYSSFASSSSEVFESFKNTIGANEFAIVGLKEVGAYNGLYLVGKGGSSVPEPATATLSLLALAGLASRRRRH